LLALITVAIVLDLALTQAHLTDHQLTIERYDRLVHRERVTLIHQEDAAQALGLDWVDDHAKFQNPDAPRDSRRPRAYRIAELLGSLQGQEQPVADFLRRLTFTVLIGDNDAHAKNLAILHLPGRSVLADVYDAVPNLFQEDRIDYDLAMAVDGSFDHRRISAAHLIREAERWNALGIVEAERIVTEMLADFAAALDHLVVPQGVSAAPPSLIPARPAPTVGGVRAASAVMRARPLAVLVPMTMRPREAVGLPSVRFPA
jgi:serine/threonine-protein kinase HipA